MSRDHPMSKRAITRLFVGGSIAVAAGIVLVLAAVWSAVSGDLAVTVTLVALGSLAALAGTVAGVVSWIGALFNTWTLEDRTWFAALFGLGLWCTGVLVMVAYVASGPDGTSQDEPRGGIASPFTRPEMEVQ